MRVSQQLQRQIRLGKEHGVTVDKDWLSTLYGPDYIWKDRNSGATTQDLEALTSFVGRPLPEDYAAFLRVCNGAFLRFDDLWQVRLWRSVDIPSWSTTYGFVPENIRGALAFGDNGGSEVLAFDVRSVHPDGQYPVLAVNYISIDWDEAIPVAHDFKSLLLLRRHLLADKGQEMS